MARPRVFISTDLRLSSEEKDDAQSLIHALLYQDKMNIVGIAGTASKWGHQDGLVGDIDKIIDIYAKDYDKLEAKGSAFKTAAELKAISWQGATDVAPGAGFSKATVASQAIIAEAEKAAAAGEKLNVVTWGGETDIAQALHDDPSIAPHIRFFNISNQDPSAHRYIMNNFKGKLDMWVNDMSTFRGMYQTPENAGIIKGWHEVHAKGHGALGDFFAQLSGDIFNKAGVKMGDSPTILRFLNGNQNDPTAESWGGEFVKAGDRYWTDKKDPGLDLNRNGTEGAITIYEDRAAWMNSFAERFDWLKTGAAPSQPALTQPAPTPTDPATPSEPTGPGADTITVKIAGTAYKGNPKFAIYVDGKVVDPNTVVVADFGKGWDTFTFMGDYDGAGTQKHKVEIDLTNSLAREGVGDRKLYVDAVTFNGVKQTQNVAITNHIDKDWFFTI
jgi:hypothetical protein